MSEQVCKAIIYKDLEDVYGPCGCGMNLATLPVLLPRDWVIVERPAQAEYDEFGKGFDFRRTSGFTCNQVFEHEMDGIRVHGQLLLLFGVCREGSRERVCDLRHEILSESTALKTKSVRQEVSL